MKTAARRRALVHNFGGVKIGPVAGEERDYRMMQQPTADGERAWRGEGTYMKAKVCGYAYSGASYRLGMFIDINCEKDGDTERRARYTMCG